MAGMINIHNPKTGEAYAVLPADFRRNKDGQYDGFVAGDYEDGTPYEAPAKAAEKGAETKKGTE